MNTYGSRPTKNETGLRGLLMNYFVSRRILRGYLLGYYKKNNNDNNTSITRILNLMYENFDVNRRGERINAI